MATIKSNSNITARFVTDSDLRPSIKVVDRKGNFATIIVDGKTERKKIYNDGTREYVYPYGRYSMAPIAY